MAAHQDKMCPTLAEAGRNQSGVQQSQISKEGLQIIHAGREQGWCQKPPTVRALHVLASRRIASRNP